MEEELSKSHLKSDDSSSDKEISQIQTQGKHDKTNDLKFKDQDDQLDSTCESILSSINEECIKISREKENGIEENSMNSTDGQAASSISSEDRNDEESKPSEDEMEYDHLHSAEDRSNENGALEIDETDNFSSSPKNAQDDLNSVEKEAKMDTSNSSNDSSNHVVEEGSKKNYQDPEANKSENTNANSSEEKSSKKTIGGLKIRIFSNFESKDIPDKNEVSAEKESKSNSDQDNSKEKENSGGKIKLRSFASLCSNEDHAANDSDCVNSSCKLDGPMTNLFSSEISGVAVGDIVQHSNIVESDESGVMHLKISNVVGGEDCITGLAMEDEKETFMPIQISSIASLIEPASPDVSSCEKGVNDGSIAVSSNGGCALQNENADTQQWMLDSSIVSDVSSSVQTSIDDTKLKVLCSPNSVLLEKEKGYQTVINIFKSPLLVNHSCEMCKKHMKCEFRAVTRNPNENKVGFICSENCKSTFIAKIPKDHKVVKPRIYFERICGMCGKELTGLSKSSTYSWQTREFCNKLCLADHIGEVARSCFCCKNPVRVIYMVKYCVRFGSDVHQFCSNGCLEHFKSTIKVCSFCQKNLTDINKVISPSNKEYCSNKCLKRAQRKDISQQHYKEEIDCTVCCKRVVNKFEFLHNGATTWLCSDPCLNVFKYAKQVKSVNCCLCSRLLNAEESCIYFFNGKKLGLRVFCAESCFSVFVISARKIVTCEYCKVKKYNFDMICSTSQSLEEEFYSCSVSCLNFIENQNKISLNMQAPSEMLSLKPSAENDASITTPLTVVNSNNSTVSAVPSGGTGPLLKECNMCSKVEPAQFHMVMSDSTLRSFCSYMCATRFKCTFGFQVSGGGTSLTNNKDELIKLKKDALSSPEESVKTDSACPKSTTKFDPKEISNILALLNPPAMSNKSTMCRPLTNSKGVQCKPHQWHKDMQTDVLPDKAVILPIPVPVYVPTPMMMFSAPTPVPIFIPIPIPIPVFIPTVEKTTKSLEKRIKEILDKFPCDPKESEMIMLADNEVRTKNDSETSSVVENDGTDSPVENNVVTSPVTESNAIITEEQTDDDEVAESDLELIGRIQDTLSKFSYLQSKSGNIVKNDSSKRKLDLEIMEEGPTLKKSKFDEDHLDLSYGVAVWSAWVKRKLSKDPDENSPNSQLLQEELCNMSSDVLDHCLILFLEDLSLQKEVKIDVDSLFYLLLGIQKHIFEQGSTFCIFLEINFDKFTDAFDEMVNAFYASHSQPGPGLSRRLLGTRVTEEMLWEARQLGAHTPHVLLNTLFYFNTKVFNLKEAEDHSNLSFTQILKDWKKNKLAADVSVNLTSLLKFSPITKGDSKKKAGITYEMLENKENPLRCPVKLYEFYLSKCPESIRNDRTKYYVYPERTCQPDSPVWFSTSSLQINTIEKMLNRVLLVREVQEALFSDFS